METRSRSSPMPQSGVAAQDKAPGAKVNGKGRKQGEGDLLGYRPNLDMMDIKISPKGHVKFSLTN